MRTAICLFLCGCLVSRPLAAGQDLQFAGQVVPLGCPLSVYLDGSNVFLGPAFCILNAPELLPTCPLPDRLLGTAYLSLPLTLRDPRLLAEAQRLLSGAWLARRKIQFLPVVAIDTFGITSQPMSLVWESGQETGQLQISCDELRCSDVLQEITADDPTGVRDQVLFQFEVLKPGRSRQPSVSVKLESRLSVANTSYLPAYQLLGSRGAFHAPVCTGLQPEMTFVDDIGACRVTVHRQGSELFIEPLLCYQRYQAVQRGGNFSVDVFLTVESERVRDMVVRRRRSGIRSVSFMSLADMKAEVSPVLPQRLYRTEPPRLLLGGKEAALRIQTSSEAAFNLLKDVLQNSPIDLWRHVRWSIKSIVRYECLWQSLKFAYAPKESEKCAVLSLFHKRTGSLCINPEYVEAVSTASKVSCAAKCSLADRCQGFSLVGGSCKLFKFDKCSKNVRNCNCDKTGELYIKNQQGLPLGSLCPSGYSKSRYCGVKYKLYPETRYFNASRSKCETESGLVILADVMDREEMRVVDQLCSNRSIGTFLGGYQRLGSPEPGGGWYWVSCNLPVSDSLWCRGEPNNNGMDQNSIARWSNEPGLTDLSELTDAAHGVLCECVSPFD